MENVSIGNRYMPHFKNNNVYISLHGENTKYVICGINYCIISTFNILFGNI